MLRTSPIASVTLPDFPPISHLFWPDTPAYYTDGSSAQAAQDALPAVGAAFVHVHGAVADAVTVNPNGEGETNTITRAELSGIYAALCHMRTLATATQNCCVIFTDSLASIFLIQRALRAPVSLSECKHLLLLQAIRALVAARAHQGFKTLFCKVKSHIGVRYNELADATAAKAGEDPAACQVTLADAHNAYLSSLPAWPSATPDPVQHVDADPLCPADAQMSEPEVGQATHHRPHLNQPYFFNDLSQSVQSHVLAHAPHVCVGKTVDGIYTQLRARITSTSESAPSNFMWDTRRVPFHAIRHVLTVRFGTLWTAAKAKLWGCSYNTRLGGTTDGRCPICHAATDTAGHWLARCSHPTLAASYIARHNRVVCMIQTAVMFGAMGNTYTIMDATAADSCPDGVAACRLPAWLLPNTPLRDLRRMRPDLMFVQGLSPDEAAGVRHNQDLSALKSRCKIHLVEVGYTSESSYTDTLARKRQQHTALCAALTRAGWSVVRGIDASPYHVLLIGVTGVLFRPFASTLTLLGVQQDAASSLMRDIHVHSVLSVSSLIRTRRHLENNNDLQPP